MPPIREHRILYTFLGDEDAEDGDEEMPPLVEAPAAAQRQTHMQAQEAMMSSIDFSGVTWEAPPFAPPPVLEGEDGEEAQGGGVRGGGRRGGRAGRRAGASYIPRPPNAFILFRSSFIRSQSVPGRVEGNHSTLSKIIGVWRLFFALLGLTAHREMLARAVRGGARALGRQGPRGAGGAQAAIPGLEVQTQQRQGERGCFARSLLIPAEYFHQRA